MYSFVVLMCWFISSNIPFFVHAEKHLEDTLFPRIAPYSVKQTEVFTNTTAALQTGR